MGGRIQRLLGEADLRVAFLLFVVALLLYAPGIVWGVPQATAPNRVWPWGSDELAPLGTIAETYRAILDPSAPSNPQYPLLHYFVQALFVAPYLLILKLTGGLAQVSTEYPFGLADPVSSLAVMTVLARLTSLLMAAGIVVIAYRTATTLWDRRTGVIAGALVLLMYPMFYYSRTSNVDLPALFWISLGVAQSVVILKDRLTVGRAAWLGVFAALATATKDASWLVFLALGVVLVPLHLGRCRRESASLVRAWKPLLTGLGAAAATYLVASGFVLSPSRFSEHVDYILASTAAFVYPPTLSGYLLLLRETGGHVVASLGWPVVVAALGGIILTARRAPLSLTLLLPAVVILAGTILPVRFVNFRYVLITSYMLVFFAAYALAVLGAGEGRRVRAAPVVLIAVLAWSLVRGLDLTRQMVGDSRYRVGQWMEAQARVGDRVGYFGAPVKLPYLPAGVESKWAAPLCDHEAWASEEAPDFVLIVPQQHFEVDREFTLPEPLYRALEDGSLGYTRAVRHQTSALSRTRAVPFVNPPVQVFVRDGHPAAAGERLINEAASVLGAVGSWLTYAVGRPAGLVRNDHPRTYTDACPVGAPFSDRPERR